MTATTVNVNAVVDEAKFKPFHLKIVLWCVFVVILTVMIWQSTVLLYPY